METTRRGLLLALFGAGLTATFARARGWRLRGVSARDQAARIAKLRVLHTGMRAQPGSIQGRKGYWVTRYDVTACGTREVSTWTWMET